MGSANICSTADKMATNHNNRDLIRSDSFQILVSGLKGQLRNGKTEKDTLYSISFIDNITKKMLALQIIK